MTTSEYNKCVDLYSDRIYRFILKQLADKDKANDIVQEAFIRLWNKVQDVNFEKAKSYLFTTAYHSLVDDVRTDKRINKLKEYQKTDTVSYNSYSDLKEILNIAVDKLPEIQKSVVLLRDYEGYSYKEIGDIMELSESQVKVYIFRARKALKAFLVSMDVVV
tara:strand:+ start:156 stop:641 length:486 start_codon:yes stop_codon:yes gene_type:complete